MIPKLMKTKNKIVQFQVITVNKIIDSKINSYLLLTHNL